MCSGIRHRNTFVRGRACYLFLRIFRELTKDIRPYFTHVMESIVVRFAFCTFTPHINISAQPLLTISLSEQDQPLMDSDQQYLYEIAGIITFELRDNQQVHVAILDVCFT